jgi:hypothetical protein
MESATKGRFRAQHPDRKLEVGPGNAYERGNFLEESLGESVTKSVGVGPGS